jgi:predicted NAD/FAD-dependent oxidoreductase
MSGAACGEKLAQNGVDVTLYEKSRGHGGRASTRYTDHDGLTFDHGAQYFTTQFDGFRSQVNEWINREVVVPWIVDPAVIESGTVVDRESSTDRYVGIPKMNEIVKDLASTLDKEFQRKVQTIEEESDGWQLVFADGTRRTHDTVVVTAPPAQAADLLEGSLPDLVETVRSVQMQPTWSLMLAFDERVDVPYNAAFVNDEPLSWIGRNSSKPGRDGPESWVIHANHQWSAQHIGKNPDTVLQKLRENFLELTGSKAENIILRDVHRWRYAKALEPRNDRILSDQGCLVAGDWLCGSRVEGAFRSGRAAAQTILEE